MAQHKSKSNTVQIRRYTCDSIQKLYDKMQSPTLPEKMQKIIQNIQNELAKIKKESENRNPRNNRHFKRRTSNQSTNNSHSSNILINRSKIEPINEFVNFQKKSNLILNSLIDSNVLDVGERLIRLIKQQSEILKSNQEIVDTYGSHICSQIVGNATMQPIYSQAYVTVVKLCVEAMQESPYVEMGKWIKKNVAHMVLHVEPTHITKLSARGNAKLATYLYIEKCISRIQFDEYIQKWLNCVAENEQHICELIVHLFLTLSEYATHKKEWLPFVKDMIQPLWENDSSVGMRARIRLWDIRDAYIS